MKVFIGAWAAVIVTFAALASVPAYRKPWTIRTDAVSASPGILVSDPITQFVTPYVSFAAVRGAATPDLQITPQVRIVSGADPPTSMQDIDARTLLTGADAVAAHNGDGFSWRWRQAVQFDATSQIRIVVLGASGVSRSTVEVGYDGRTPAVRAVRFWWPWILSFAIAGVAMLAWPATWARQRNLSGTLRTGITEAPLLCLLLIIAVGLRLALTYAGGQYFDGDETRYGAGAVNVFDLLSAGYPREALDAVLNAPDHPGFRIFAAGAALFHVASAALTRQPIAEMRVHSGEWLPAFVLSLSSAVSILLVYLIAERSGADRRESTIAAALMLCSQTMLMYSRGFFPYDVSMALLLGALWIGQKPGGVARSFVAGALAGLAVFVYEGHWLMGAAVGSVHALHRLRPVRGAVVHSVVFVLGSLSIWTAFLAAARFRQVPLLDALEAFSRNVTHGDFAEGWTLTWKSLLTIDGPVMMVSLAGCALVFVFAASRSSRSQRGLVWLAAAALIALGLGISSNVLHRFVVYDRLARQLVPFLCLASAAGWSAMFGPRLSQRATATFTAVLLALWLGHAWPWLTLRFPREVIADVIATYGKENIRLDSTFPESVVDMIPVFTPFEGESNDNTKRYVLLNAKDIWINAGWDQVAHPPDGKVVFTATHPRQLPGMQFHGYLPRQRAFFKAIDFSIRLIDTAR